MELGSENHTIYGLTFLGAPVPQWHSNWTLWDRSLQKRWFCWSMVEFAAALNSEEAAGRLLLQDPSGGVDHLLGRSGDLVSRLSNGPYGAYGLLWGLIGDTKWTY